MAKLECNFKVENNKTGGNHNGRKPGSKNKLTLKSLDKKLDSSIKALDKKLDSSIKALDKKLDSSIKALDAKIDKLADIIQNLAKEMREGFAHVNARIDNLVLKNNLKE